MQNKNISHFLIDIKHPALKKTAPPRASEFELPGVLANQKKMNSLRFIAILAVMIITSSGFMVWHARENAVGQALTAYRNFIFAFESARQLDADGVVRALSQIETSPASLDAYSRILGLIPAFRKMPEFVSAIDNFNQATIAMADVTNSLKKEWASLLWNDGPRLISNLESIKSHVRTTTYAFTKIRNGIVLLDSPADISADYLAFHSKMIQKNSLLEGVVDLLKSGGNIIILFMNSSEMRAGGGSIESYAIVQINNGAIKEMSINDISRLDGLSGEGIIPPSPMMGLSANWRAEDSSWFFDFPTSISKVRNFIEKAPLYAEKEMKFNGVVAMNYKVFTDILRITGPITFPERGIVIDSTNFITHIEKDPMFLQFILPELISRMQRVSGASQEEFLRIIESRFNNKDIQAYFTDTRLQSFISDSLWGGKIYQIRELAYEDYLAVAVSNIGGEKSDAYMRQRVALESVMEASGIITSTLTVTRVHEGDRATKAFHKAKNQAHIRALVPRGARLFSVEGATARTVRPMVNYEEGDYKRDADVELFEQGIESGKAVFGRWLTVDPGSDGKLVIKYNRPAIFSNNFRFTYEKQSGVDSIFSYSIQAPSGYIFKETGTSIYTYKNANLPARLIIDLTLQAK